MSINVWMWRYTPVNPATWGSANRSITVQTGLFIIKAGPYLRKQPTQKGLVECFK
jgi:hypothetical protein